MQESTKTKVFVGGAALMVLAAAISHFVNQPRVAGEFAKVGEPFFENFQSSDQATSLEVVAVDPETAERNRFKVAKIDGLWRIPSHENYPAEASARLATTASSIIGIERESLAGRGKTDFERLGVEDPLNEEVEDPEAVGQRITLKDENDETLADYIIGKQVEDVAQAPEDRPFESGENRQTYFYVRHADEQQTYIVPLKLDLSTRFSDWIDPDLLRFESSDLSQITVRNYSLEEQVGGNPLIPQRALVKKTGDTLELAKGESGSWELAGVDDAKEEFDSGSVTEMVDVLNELRIDDVRRKSTFQDKQLLTPDLKLNDDPEFLKSPEQYSQAIQRLVSELEDKGFNLAGTQEQLELVSNNGEIQFGTTEGLRYTLHIGAPFEEGDSEIKVAGSVDTPDEGDGKNTESEPNADATDASEAEDDAKSRFMLVRVEFDQSLLSDAPEEPVKPDEPKKPEGYTPLPDSEITSDQADDSKEAVDDDAGSNDEPSAGDAESDSDKKSDGKESESVEETDEAEARPAFFEAYEKAMERHEQALVDYELEKTRYEDDQKKFAERVEEARKLEAELNERFGEWYYVISGENLKALQLSRADLVTKKKPPVVPAAKDPSTLPARPDISFDGGPEDQQESSEEVTEAADTAESKDETELKPDSPNAYSDTTDSRTAETEPAAETSSDRSSDLSNESAAPVENTGKEVVEPAADGSVAEPVPQPSTTAPTAEE